MQKSQYMCYLCKQGDMRSGKELYRHLMGHGEADYACAQCGKVFRYRRLLNRHVLAVHDEFQVSAQWSELFLKTGGKKFCVAWFSKWQMVRNWFPNAA